MSVSSADVRVSVVVPAFNAEEWIASTLESVAAQTAPELIAEIIVVDDASGDGTIAVAQRFFESSRIPGQVIALPENGGVSRARNRGWQLARGEWIQFLDADDRLAPTKLAVQGEVANTISHDVDVIYSPWCRLSKSDHEQWAASGPLITSFVDEDPVVDIVADDLFGFLGPTLIRRSTLERTGGFDEAMRAGEDKEFMLRLAMSGGGFQRVDGDMPLFFYRETPNSLAFRTYDDHAAMQSRIDYNRRVEQHLRLRGALPLAARQALMHKYCTLYDWTIHLDLQSQLLAAMAPLRLPVEIDNVSPRMRRLGEVIGEVRALRLRIALKSTASRLRGLRRRDPGTTALPEVR